MLSAVVWLLMMVTFSQPGQGLAESDRTTPASGRINWLTGKRFQQELDQPLSGSWANLEFRQLVKDVSAERLVAVVIDRRIDPSAQIPIQVNNVPLRIGLNNIARQVGAETTVCNNLVYLGPKRTTGTLRTLIELRSQELQAKDAKITTLRRTELLRYQMFTSRDLDTPREILEKFAGQSKLTVENPQAVPHDLWAALALPEVSVIDALSIVLTQFDLTFQWKQEGRAIELVPIPEVLSVERRYPVKKKAAEVLAQIRQAFPDLKSELVKSEIVIQGLTEDHEAIVALLKGEPTRSPVKIDAPQPLRKQVFLLKVEQVPVSAIMKNLEETGVTFEYDPEELKQAGIDLDTRVDIDVKKATADEFFQLVFGPVGLQFQLDHLTVKLKPKK